MLNTRDLEERWLKYKIKSYIPHAIISISLTIIIVIVFIFLNSNKQEEKRATLSPKINVEKEIEKKKTVVTKIEKESPPQKKTVLLKEQNIKEAPQSIAIVSHTNSLENNDTLLKLSPSLGFMKKMQHSSLPYYQEENTIQQEEPITSQIVEEIQELEIAEDIAAAVLEKKPKKINIKRRDTSDDIRHIIKRFKKNNNPALSLFIAKKYYELGEYHKAYNYALITNEIDRNIDASWIVFTKSLVKLDQKEMAIKTLKRYIENSHSNSAKILLEEILSGKFK